MSNIKQHWLSIGSAAVVTFVLALQIAILVMQSKLYHKSDANTTGGKKTQGADSASKKTITVIKNSFGKTGDGKDVNRYTLNNSAGMSVQLLTYGATIASIRVPDKNGLIEDVTLGYDNLSGFERNNTPFFGAFVGRVANRITLGRFSIDGVSYQLNTNKGRNHLHGGNKGWDKAVWTAVETADGVLMSHISPDGDELYPGRVAINVTYQLTEDSQLVLKMSAITSGKATPINPTSHSYFNLAGEGVSHLNDQLMTILADYYLPTTSELIPTGERLPVNGTVYDLRSSTDLGQTLVTYFNYTDGGYDNTFCLRGPEGKRKAAVVHHAPSGRKLEVFTNQPGLQFYTSNTLHVSGWGKGGHSYHPHSAFCLETQNYPDAVNKPNFPDSVLREGSTYEHWVSYKFSVQ